MMKKPALIYALAILAIVFVACTKYRDVPSKSAPFVPPPDNVIQYGSLRINEFMAKGTDPGAMALMQQATAKWFELYNPTGSDIVLEPDKWFFTDDLTNPTKAAVTQNTAGVQWTVPAHGYLLIACPKQDGSTTPAPNRFNTYFSLSSTVGAIGVFYKSSPSANVQVIDTVSYSLNALSGISYGRRPDGSNPATVQLGSVTPEATNGN